MDEGMWALVGCARCGQVELSIDESVDTPGIFEMEVCLPSVELRFRIDGPGAVVALSRFLRDQYQRTVFAEMQVGTIFGVPVRIIKDDEHADRFWLRAAAGSMIDVPIVGVVTNDLVRAAEELMAEIAAT